jgi:UDP-N-acetylmuramoyl-tripeptide--D-alanyl-D-alanine ligase
MISITLAEAAEAMHGEACGLKAEALTRALTGVVTDSRLAGDGTLFVAIPGDRVDGHDFAEEAHGRGAVAALVNRRVDGPSILVADTVLALGQLASTVRRRLSGCSVIAITGSSGKTSTKDLLAQVLDSVGPTVAPEGSFNTEVGLPMTILRADEGTRHLILEMGMRGIGHISYLCDLAVPDIGILLNVGSAHLGLLGSREAIAEAKGEILDLLPADGFAILGGDDPAVMSQAHRAGARVVTFGEGESVDVRATHVELDAQARAHFTVTADGHRAEVRLQFHGRHYVANALAVAAACLSLGHPLDWTAQAISGALPRSRWRMEVHRSADGTTVINDAYNANPESMRAALQTLAAMSDGRRSWAVLGQMLELGEISESEHAQLGQLASRLGIRLVCAGPGTEAMHQAALAGQGISVWVEGVDEANALLAEELRPGDIVLVKASRGIGLDRVAVPLVERLGATLLVPVASGGQG